MSTALVEGLALGYLVYVTAYLRFCEHKLKCSCTRNTLRSDYAMCR